MKKSKFTGEQIAYALRQADLGVTVAEVCRKMGIVAKQGCITALAYGLRSHWQPVKRSPCRAKTRAFSAPSSGGRPSVSRFCLPRWQNWTNQLFEPVAKTLRPKPGSSVSAAKSIGNARHRSCATHRDIILSLKYLVRRCPQ